MLAKDLQRTVQRQCFDRSTSSGGGVGPEKRVVDCLFGGFDHGQKERRDRIVCECFDRCEACFARSALRGLMRTSAAVEKAMA